MMDFDQAEVGVDEEDYGENCSDENDDDSDDDKARDPDWQKTPLFEAHPGFRSTARRKTDLFRQNTKEARLSTSKKCKCQQSCKTKRCACRKNGAFCDDQCSCGECENREVQSTTSGYHGEGKSHTLPVIITSDMEEDQQTVTSSVLNTTFDVEETPPDKEPVPDTMATKVKVTGKPPIRLKKQIGRSILGSISVNETSVRSSDEFEAPMKKSQSYSSFRKRSSSSHGGKSGRSMSNLRKTGSSSSLKKRANSSSELHKIGDSEDRVSTEGLEKKRKLYNARESFFDDIYTETKTGS